MAQHTATVSWKRGTDETFTDRKYSRRHEWSFDGGAVVTASAAPSVVPVPMSDPAGVDPEEALIASISSCHMLFFLDYASKEGFVIESYVDKAHGTLGKNADGRFAITSVVLRPEIRLAAGSAPDVKAIMKLHDMSHKACFIANSVNFPVTVNMR